MKKLCRTCIATMAVVLLAGCSSHYSSIDYEPTRQPMVASGTQGVSLVRVTDSRGTPNNWLGAIRGGYGNPIKKIYTEEPASEVVRKAFESALSTRGLLDTSSVSGMSLDVDVTKFDTSYYFNKEAHAHLSVMLNDADGDLLYQRDVRKDREAGGVGAGIFGDVEALSDFANETLNEAIDDALGDPRFLAELTRTRPSRKEDVEGVNDHSIAERLRQLEQLEVEGVITESEYIQKRSELIESL